MNLHPTTTVNDTTTEVPKSGARAYETADEKRTRFETEVRPHLQAVRGAARRLTKSEADADDLFQETMLRAFRYFDRFQAGTNLKAWLLQIQRNVFFNAYQRNKRERSVTNESTEAVYEGSMSHGSVRYGTQPDTNVERPRIARAIHDALEELPEPARSIVVRADIDGWSYKEIAAEQGTPIGTVMSRRHRARKALQHALEVEASELGIVGNALQAA